MYYLGMDLLNMKPFKIIPLVVASFFTSTTTFAASCSDYPVSPGLEVIETSSGGIKIKSTALVTVPINDAELYLDALEEAEMEAKARISRFLSEEIINKCMDEKSRKLAINVNHEGNKSVNYEKVKTTLCSIKNQSRALLKGALRISDCYTPGKYVIVSVGIKPGTIRKNN